jgi:hypothetical protein
MMTSEHNPWDKVAKRLAAKARGTVRSGAGNFGVIHVSIYVNAQGCPIGWTAPKGERLEPRGPWIANLIDKID